VPDVHFMMMRTDGMMTRGRNLLTDMAPWEEGAAAVVEAMTVEGWGEGGGAEAEVRGARHDVRL